MKLGEGCVGNVYYFCNFSQNLIIIPKQKIYFKVSCWENTSRDGMGDQEERKDGSESRAKFRTQEGELGSKEVHFVDLTVGRPRPSPRSVMANL